MEAYSLSWWMLVIGGSIVGCVLYNLVAGYIKRVIERSEALERLNERDKNIDLALKERRLDCAIKANESRFQFPVKDGKLVIDNVFWRTVKHHDNHVTSPIVGYTDYAVSYSDLPFFQFSTSNTRTRVTIEVLPDEPFDILKNLKKQTDVLNQLK